MKRHYYSREIEILREERVRERARRRSPIYGIASIPQHEQLGEALQQVRLADGSARDAPGLDPAIMVRVGGGAHGRPAHRIRRPSTLRRLPGRSSSGRSPAW